MSGSKSKILLLGNLDHEQKTWDSQVPSSSFETIQNPASEREEFLELCKSGKLDGVLAIYRTFNSVAQTGLYDQELVDALPSSLKFIAHNGAGYDQLSSEPLAKKGIVVTNVPTAVDDATADTALYLMIGALRNFNISMTALRKNEWRGKPAPSLGHDPQGKVLGILGMGGIGRNLAHKSRALGMTIAYHNRNRLDPSLEAGAQYMGFDELLAKSDVLSVHVPLNEKTKHLISKKELAKCKKGVVIVNTARGAVIDEAALVEALDSGHVASAGLDVYEQEPKIHEGLVRNERCTLLPHMGTWTIETQAEMERWCIGNVRAGVDGLLQSDKKKEFWQKLSVIPEHKQLLEEKMKS